MYKIFDQICQPEIQNYGKNFVLQGFKSILLVLPFFQRVHLRARHVNTLSAIFEVKELRIFFIIITFKQNDKMRSILRSLTLFLNAGKQTIYYYEKKIQEK